MDVRRSAQLAVCIATSLAGKGNHAERITIDTSRDDSSHGRGRPKARTPHTSLSVSRVCPPEEFSQWRCTAVTGFDTHQCLSGKTGSIIVLYDFSRLSCPRAHPQCGVLFTHEPDGTHTVNASPPKAIDRISVHSSSSGFQRRGFPSTRSNRAGHAPCAH